MSPNLILEIGFGISFYFFFKYNRVPDRVSGIFFDTLCIIIRVRIPSNTRTRSRRNCDCLHAFMLFSCAFNDFFNAKC